MLAMTCVCTYASQGPPRRRGQRPRTKSSSRVARMPAMKQARAEFAQLKIAAATEGCPHMSVYRPDSPAVYPLQRDGVRERDGSKQDVIWRQFGVAAITFCVVVTPVLPGVRYLFGTSGTHVVDRSPTWVDFWRTSRPESGCWRACWVWFLSLAP